MANRNGWDLYETLERAGLLLSLDRRKLIEAAVLANLLVQLEDQQHTALAQLGGGQTVTGAVNGCTKFIELFAKSLH